MDWKQKMMKFTIEGDPVGKARPRVYQGRAITPAKTRHYEEWIRISYQIALQEQGETIESVFLESDIPVEITIKALFPIPKSYSKKKQKAILQGKLKPTKKPDIDNITKAILDALNGLAFHDDSQIVKLNVVKDYASGEKGSVEVLIDKA